VPPRDVQALAEAIVALSRDPGLRQRLGRAAARRARSEFSWVKIARKAASLYRQATSARRVAPTAAGATNP